MKLRQIGELIEWINISKVSLETKRKWENRVEGALSETDGDAAFESLRRRFSRKYGLRLGGCTERLAAA